VRDSLATFAERIRRGDYGQVRSYLKECVTWTDCQHFGSASNLLSQSRGEIERTRLPRIKPFTYQARFVESALTGFEEPLAPAGAAQERQKKRKKTTAPKNLVKKWSKTIAAVGHEFIKVLASYLTKPPAAAGEWAEIAPPVRLVSDARWRKGEVKAEAQMPSEEFWALKRDG